MNDAKPVAVFVMGPTASGKTDLAIKLTQQFPCDIISVDSVLVYRDMDIGTAKPTADELKQAPHRLINICDPTEAYSAANFRADAMREMTEISRHDRIPLLVGGTGLYFRALEYGLSQLPQADKAVRIKLLLEAEQIGWQAMHQKLQEVDPQAAKKIHPNDPQRIQRALEVYVVTGQPMSQLQQKHRDTDFPYRIIKLIQAPYNREQLRERIARRFHLMLQQGFEEEVRNLLENYVLTSEMPSMRSVGYRQMLSYIRGEASYEEMTETVIIATRQLAKRQMTWLRREEHAIWLNNKENSVEAILHNQLR